MLQEPEWTKTFSNETVCNYYYYLSVALLIVGAINVLFVLYLLFSTSKMRGFLIGSLIGQLITLAIGYFVYLFAFLTCTRSLGNK